MFVEVGVHAVCSVRVVGRGQGGLDAVGVPRIVVVWRGQCQAIVLLAVFLLAAKDYVALTDDPPTIVHTV
jgi:hypothetical protein